MNIMNITNEKILTLLPFFFFLIYLFLNEAYVHLISNYIVSYNLQLSAE